MKIFTFFVLFLFLKVDGIAMTIKAEPLTLKVSIEKNDFSVNFIPQVSLVCTGTKRCPWDCNDLVETKLLKTKTSIAFETNKEINYSIEYNNKDSLKNPFSPLKYKNLNCKARVNFEISDPIYINPEGLNSELVSAWAVYSTQTFEKLKDLNNIKFKYYYTWEQTHWGKSCQDKSPFLCRKFLYLIPNLKPESAGGTGTDFLFPAPAKLHSF